MSDIDIVFDGPPSHEAPRFVEVERDGSSINYGEWVHREDGYWVLRIPDNDEATQLRNEVSDLRAFIDALAKEGESFVRLVKALPEKDS